MRTRRAILFTVLTIILFGTLLPFAWSWARVRTSMLETTTSLEYLKTITLLEEDIATDFWQLLNTTTILARNPPLLTFQNLTVSNYTSRFSSYEGFISNTFANKSNLVLNFSLTPIFSINDGTNVSVGPIALRMTNLTIAKSVNATIRLSQSAQFVQRIQLSNVTSPAIRTKIYFANGTLLDDITNPQLWVFTNSQNQTNALLVDYWPSTYTVSGDASLLQFVGVPNPPAVDITASLAYVIANLDVEFSTNETLFLKAGSLNTSVLRGLQKTGQILLGSG